MKTDNIKRIINIAEEQSKIVNVDVSRDIVTLKKFIEEGSVENIIKNAKVNGKVLLWDGTAFNRLYAKQQIADHIKEAIIRSMDLYSIQK